MDLIKLPEVDGFKYVAIAVDYLSKYSLAKPLKDKSAESVADFIFEWICLFGCPEVQINDQGKEFCNAVLEELNARTGIEQRVTAAYHPQTNGLVENFNGTVKDGLLKVLEEHIEVWPSALPGVLFAHRTQQHRSTKYSPFFTLFGQEPVLPIDLVDSIQNLGEENCSDPDEPDAARSAAANDADAEADLNKLRAATNAFLVLKKDVLGKARKNIKKAQETQKYYYDKRHSSGQIFKLGDKVLLKNLRRTDRKGDWSQEPFTGPFVLVQEGLKGSFKIRNPKTGHILKKWQNVRNLKLYHERKDSTEVNETVKKHNKTESSQTKNLKVRLERLENGLWSSSVPQTSDDSKKRKREDETGDDEQKKKKTEATERSG